MTDATPAPGAREGVDRDGDRARASPSGVDAPVPALPEARGEVNHGAVPAARRFTYVLLTRVILTSLLLIATLLTDLAVGETTPWLTSTLPPIAAGYALSVLWAVLLRRGAPPVTLAAWQSACDLVIASILLHADRSPDSGAVLWFLLVVGGAATMMNRRDTAVVTIGAGATYLFVSVADRGGLLPAWPGDAIADVPLSGAFLLLIARNTVFLIAIAVLTRRLAGELERAGASIAEKDARIDALASLHADVVRSLTSGLITIGASGAVRSINPAGAEILGVDRKGLAGRPLEDVVPSLSAIVAAPASTTPLRRTSIDHRRGDGSLRHLGVSVAPLVDADGHVTGRVLNFQDLTELRTMQERANRAERLAAIGRLAAGVAHEIRNPLAAISGSIELLRSTEMQGENRELMDIVTREVDRLNRLITELLDYARPQRPEPARVDARAAIEELLVVIENDRRVTTYPGRVVLDAAGPVWIEVDPAQFRQVLLNLLLNAADASPADAPVEVGVSAVDGACLIAIRDRGPGIPAELRARLFEPFFSTKKGGSGLGLPTVHRIVDQHGGTITIEDRPGGGATATVSLRLAPNPGPGPGPVAGAHP